MMKIASSLAPSLVLKISYSAAILLMRKLSVRGHLKTRTALSREFVHEQNRNGAEFWCKRKLCAKQNVTNGC